jgi:purine-nucleoside phosphorylase
LFDSSLQDSLLSTAADVGLRLQEGVYCWLKGPSYETPAEIEMLGRAGADAVGMSTVPEILEANTLGMRIVGISLISNLAAGISASKLSHEEVTETANRVKVSFTNLLREFLLRQNES